MNDSYSNQSREPLDFIREKVAEDVRKGVYRDRVVTRFPPEPNGYLHIGHAKSICLNFGAAQEFGGRCHLRFDDTNPETEDMEYVEAAMRDVRWLGFDWGPHLYFASDYYEQLYDWAVQLIKQGKAYVDDLSDEQIKEYRGTVLEPGRESPFRQRSVTENLDLFGRMRNGEFEDGERVLRAKIDMTHPNMKMRDPLMYRIRHITHYRRGDDWCIYPMYDWAHGQSDAIEGVTHSICTLEFENNRELYDWFLENLGFKETRPHQYEFARLNLDYTVMSKRKLLQLVDEGYVSGWDDPRLSTISAMRRRGYSPVAIRNLAERVGVARVNSRVEFELLEHCVRDDLNYRAPRVLCVLRPLKVTLTNYPVGHVEELDASYWPHDVPNVGSRHLPFGRELFIDRDDFAENPPKGFYRLSPGQEVRLRHAYVIRCDEVIKDAGGEIVELRCSYDAATLGANPEGRKVKGTLHWVSADRAVPCEVRLYDRLFTAPNPDEAEEGKTFKDYLNPHSVEIVNGALVEPSVLADAPDLPYQFERLGYFWQDPVDSKAEALVFNRIVALRESWSRQTATSQAKAAQKTESAPRPQISSSPGQDGSTVDARIDVRARARAEEPALAAAYARYTTDLGLSSQDANLLTGDASLVRFFDDAIAAHPNARSVANWVTNVLLGEVKDRGLESLPFGGDAFGQLVALVDQDAISAPIAREVLAEMLRTGGDPRTIVQARGLQQIGDAGSLTPVIAEIMAAYPDKVAAYRSGKTDMLGFFVGQVMRATAGKASPQLVSELVQTSLDQK